MTAKASERDVTYEASDGSLWTIYYEPPPIPTRSHDWTFYHEDYDGPGDERHGTASSVDAAIEKIESWVEEDSEDSKDPIEVVGEMTVDEIGEMIQETRERLRAIRRALVVNHQMEADLLLNWTSHVEGALAAGEDVAARLSRSPSPGEKN